MAADGTGSASELVRNVVEPDNFSITKEAN